MEELSILDLIQGLKKKCTIKDEDFLQKNELSQAEYNMFLCLKNCKHFNSYSVADKMELSLSRVSRIIDKMVSKGYLTRTTNKVDRRAIDIKMTSKGEENMRAIISYREQSNQHLLSHLSPEETQEIKTSLKKLTSIL